MRFNHYNLEIKAPSPINDPLSEKLVANIGQNLKGNVEDKNVVEISKISRIFEVPNPQLNLDVAF